MPISEAEKTACPSCDAPIAWAITQKRRRSMPVDFDPHPDGNVAVYTDVTGRLRVRALTSERPTPEGSETVHKPHFATCEKPPPRRSVPRRRAGVRPGTWRRPS